MPQPQFIPSPLKIIEGAGARIAGQNDDDRHQANGAKPIGARSNAINAVMKKSLLVKF
jgi:hypothetical protein